MAEKFFNQWIDLKSDIHFKNTYHRFAEGEIWWCACGENVGVEINGKSQYFSRPVLIYKKLSQHGFLGLFLTSQPKTGIWYSKINIKGKPGFVALCQARTLSGARLYDRICVLSETDFERVRSDFLRLYA